MAADVHESAQPVAQAGAAEVRQRRGISAARVVVGRPLERLDAARQEQILPGDGAADAGELEGLHHARSSPVGPPLVLVGDLFGADELVERRRQLLAERRRAQHGVDAGQVVVHAGAVHADDLPQRIVDRREAPRRQSERAAEVPEVVVIAGRRHRVEQRRDRLREVLVDVGVRPEDLARVSSA